MTALLRSQASAERCPGSRDFAGDAHRELCWRLPADRLHLPRTPVGFGRPAESVGGGAGSACPDLAPISRNTHSVSDR